MTRVMLTVASLRSRLFVLIIDPSERSCRVALPSPLSAPPNRGSGSAWARARGREPLWQRQT